MTRLGDIFLDTGHIYISKRGYVFIEVYSSDQMVCDYVARMIGGSVRSHMQIGKVVIHSRQALMIASGQLLRFVGDTKVEEQLRLVLEYSKESSKTERNAIVELLRKSLNKEENNDNNIEVEK